MKLLALLVVAVLVVLSAGRVHRSIRSLHKVGIDADDRIVVVDGGSSGTKVNIFSYDGATVTATGATATVKPGIALYSRTARVCANFEAFTCTDEDGVDKTGESLQDYMGRIAAHITQQTLGGDHPFHVAILTTAGMRDMMQAGEFDNGADGFYAEACGFIPGSASCDGRLLTGDDEAKYAFVTANMAKGNPGAGAGFGIAEFGGSSAQVGFESTAEPAIDVTIGAKTYHAYLHSWLGLGNSQLKERLQGEAGYINHCNPDGTGGGAHSYPDCRAFVVQKLDELFFRNTAVPTDLNDMGEHLRLLLFGAAATVMNNDAANVQNVPDLIARGPTYCTSDAQQLFPGLQTYTFVNEMCFRTAVIDVFMEKIHAPTENLDLVEAPLAPSLNVINNHPMGWPMGAARALADGNLW